MAAYQRARRARLKAAAEQAPHGTVDGYTNWMCRCEQCRSAMTAAHADWRSRARTRQLPSGAHGRNDTYNNYSCRCEPCMTAHRDYMSAWRAARRTAGAS
jgi:hypothetical protein